MIEIKNKKTIRIILIFLAAALVLGLLFFLFFSRETEPDPYALLEEATCLSEENLCLTAILQQEPQSTEYRTRLLKNYRSLGADELTLLAARGDFDLPLPEAAAAPEAAGAILGYGGIYSNGHAYTEREDGDAVAAAGETAYFATENGIYADFKGLQVLISPARADCLYAAENGLYYLNSMEKRVQYVARDGHKTETLSAIEAQSFTFLNDTLWIVGTDGRLYCEDKPMESEQTFRTIAAAGTTLYAEGYDYEEKTSLGLFLWDGTRFKQVSFSPVSALIGGFDGLAYFINEGGYPACYDPENVSVSILAEESASAVCHDNGDVFYLNAEKELIEL